MVQPHIPQQPVIPLLVEEQATVVAEPNVRFAVDVEIGCLLPHAVLVVLEENGAFADADEDADVFAASVK